MRVIPCMMVLALLCMSATGCSLFKKNTNVPGPAVNGPAPPKFPGAHDPLLNSNIPTPPAFPPAAAPPTTQTSFGTSTLAGTVIDAYYRPVPNAYIRWVNLDEKEGGAPIDVAANSTGHFIIQGLKAGSAYKLMARTKNGDKMVAGTVLTTAPNTRVAIMVSEDKVNSSTPPLPGAPVAPAEGISKNTDKGAAKSKLPFDPLFGLGKKPTPEPSLPATMHVPTPVGKTPAHEPAFIPGIGELPKNGPPVMKMPNPKTPRVPGDSKLDTGPTRVPSCVLVGNHLENFAVKDIKGQNWEYRKHGAGKLVLLDFWATHCVYCRDGMPALNRMQQQYGARGLEVIGIALEAGKDEKKEAEAVTKFCSSMQLTYRQLLGRNGAFDLGKHFRIEGVPTLILLNDQGDIILQHTGRLDPGFLVSLERTIQAHLGNRPF